MDIYEGKTDVEVLELAKAALLREATMAAGSIERSIQQLKFDSAMMELRRRAFNHVLAQIRAQET